MRATAAFVGGNHARSILFFAPVESDQVALAMLPFCSEPFAELPAGWLLHDDELAKTWLRRRDYLESSGPTFVPPGRRP